MRRLLLALALVLGVSLAHAAEPLRIPPTHPAIRYTGRFDWRDPRGPRCAWAGSRITIAFTGTALAARLTDTGPEDFLVVSVNDRQPTLLRVHPGQTLYPLARNLPPGRHTVAVVKRTEPLVGTLQLLGFEAPTNTRLHPVPRPTRRLEIIGDSISCGFGVEAASEKEPFTARTENNTLSYGALAARALNAEVHCIAWSGRKMAPDNTMPKVYDRILPTDPTSRWNFAKWTPDAVVINLATNDFRGGVPDRSTWTDAWLAFLARVRSHYPRAHVYCALGTMLTDRWPPQQRHLTTARAYLQDIVARSKDPRVHFLEFPEQKLEDGLGASWHPSRKTHRLMARRLTETLSRDLGWPAPRPPARRTRSGGGCSTTAALRAAAPACPAR